MFVSFIASIGQVYQRGKEAFASFECIAQLSTQGYTLMAWLRDTYSCGQSTDVTEHLYWDLLWVVEGVSEARKGRASSVALSMRKMTAGVRVKTHTSLTSSFDLMYGMKVRRAIYLVLTVLLRCLTSRHSSLYSDAHFLYYHHEISPLLSSDPIYPCPRCTARAPHTQRLEARRTLGNGN